MLLKNKKLLITGVITKHSIAYHTAKTVQAHGAEIILTALPGKTARLTEKTAENLNPVPPILEMDVSKKDQVEKVRDELLNRWGTFDGFLHSIAYAPPSCLGAEFSSVSWEDVAQAFHISAYSLASLGGVFAPLMPGGAIVALDFDASVVWSGYNWMGVCKAGLESVSRYLALELGAKYEIRVNCIASGPVSTLAARSIPKFADFETLWKERSILPWDAAKSAYYSADTAVFLFSDLSTKITGEIIYVDGGFSKMGSHCPPKEDKE